MSLVAICLTRFRVSREKAGRGCAAVKLSCTLDNLLTVTRTHAHAHALGREWYLEVETWSLVVNCI